MDRLGSMLWRSIWNNNNNNEKVTPSILNDNDIAELSSWEMINNSSLHDHDHIHDDVHKQQQEHELHHHDGRQTLISLSNDDEPPRLVDDNHERPGSDLPDQQQLVALGDCANMIPTSDVTFKPVLSCHPIDVCDPVCNRLDEEEEVDDDYHVDDDDDDDVEYDYDDDDSRWFKKQRMTKVGKKVNSGMMKKSNKLPRYFYNKFV